MAQKPWTRWTENALDAHHLLPACSIDEAARAPTILYSWTSEPFNWCPPGTMDRLRTADDPESEYVEIIRETVAKPVNTGFVDEEDLPSWYGSPDHIIGEMFALSSRIVKGTINEVRAEEYAEDELGRVVLSTEKALARGSWEDVTDMEEDDVDFMTTDGDTWQVKSSEPSEEINADHLVIVSEDEIEVK